MVGYATSLIVQLDGLPHEYTYGELTGSGTFSTHDPQGDTLYGADIAVHPEHRGQGLAARLYEQRKKLLRRFNLRRMLAFGRIPGYAEWAGRLTAREYVDKVIAGELRDSALCAHLEAGYRCHLFSPTGGMYEQDKLHLTPVERELWGFSSGERLRVFDTAMGRVSALVCYDIEFPELSRLMTLAGTTIIFVPFSTDEKQAYWRVRHSAQARAVENSIYVVLAGNAGNLPMSSCLLNYARSAILTPCDFGFPQAGVAAEADPNVETVVTADLDLAALDQHRDAGSVRVLHDRRADLYEVRARTPIERVIVE